MHEPSILKKLSGPLALALGVAALASACGGSAPADNDLATLQDGVLAVGTDLTYPPYDMLVDGEPAGFDVEFVDELSKELGLEPKYQDTRFAQIIAGVKAGRYDLIASTLYVSAERAEQVDFVPYFQTGNSIIVTSEGGADLQEPQDLCGKQVSVVTATVIAKTMRGPESDDCEAAGKRPILVKEFPTDPEATQALLSGQVDAQMTDAAVAKSAVDQSTGRLVISSESLVYPVAVGLAVKKGNETLKTAVEGAVEAMEESGVYATLLEKYNLEPVSDDVLAASLEEQ